MNGRDIDFNKLRNDIDVKEKKYHFLNKYVSKSGNKTYSFTGYNCSMEPCFQFDEYEVVKNYYYNKGGWEMSNSNGQAIVYFNDLKFNRPRKFLAPEINDLVRVYNDHILEEIKYLSWKIFIIDQRKHKEFMFISLHMNRSKIRLPPEIVFYILSFLKGHELIFEVEIIDIDKIINPIPFSFNPDMFPKLMDIFEIIS